MCDCVATRTLYPPYYCSIRIRKLGFTRFNWRTRNVPIGPIREIVTRHCCRTISVSPIRNWDSQGLRNGESSGAAVLNAAKSKILIKAISRPNLSNLGSDEYELEFGNEDKGKPPIQFQNSTTSRNREEEEEEEPQISRKSSGGAPSASSTLDFLEFNEKSGRKSSTRRLKDEEDLLRIEGSDSDGELELEMRNEGPGPVLMRSGRQMMRRSNMIAKQVISMQSALRLGFVSQLWVDTNSWVVLVVEVRPKLLSGELERFLLQDVSQVGDVVLIRDESVMENEFKRVGLETLVGYNVVTPGLRNIGKVKGYNFNVNSGVIESLELDSFGISIIPSSLVSTYALCIKDVLEVVSDTVVVHEAAASRLQRLTKGFWDAQNARKTTDELGEYSDLEREPVQSDHGRSRRRSYIGRKFRTKMRETTDDWELPMDYL